MDRASTQPLARRAMWWLVALGLWTIFPILMAVQSAFYSAYVGHAVEWQALLPIRLADWYTCAIFTPVCFWLVRRFPVQRDRWLRNGAMQFAVMSIAVAAKFALYAEAGKRILPGERWTLGTLLARKFVPESIAFWALLAIVHAIEFHRRYREREVHAARLEAELAAARLDALTAQLQPHFLFNTLNSISTLMHRDVAAAEEMLTNLSQLLHRTLAQRDKHEVTLGEEVELLGRYLDIMKIRFADRLTIRVDLEPGLSDACVPPLVLQPLAENAIRHGISRKPGAGRIEITGRRSGTSLVIDVCDDGEGSAPGGDGIGLSNTRRRLQELYGDGQALELSPVDGGGMRVRLTIPLRRAAAAA